jgi:hypothetical protein
MKCWVCHRQARGLGHTDNRHGVGHPRRYPIDWAFCSRRCQDAFHAMYGNWRQVVEGHKSLEEVHMVDPTDVEIAAMHRCLKPFGEAAGEIGFDLSLGSYSEAQALRVIEAIVTCWTESMVAHHEATKFPPVRGMAATPDPLINPLNDHPMDDPLAGLESDEPWRDEENKNT